MLQGLTNAKGSPTHGTAEEEATRKLPLGHEIAERRRFAFAQSHGSTFSVAGGEYRGLNTFAYNTQRRRHPPLHSLLLCVLVAACLLRRLGPRLDNNRSGHTTDRPRPATSDRAAARPAIARDHLRLPGLARFVCPPCLLGQAVLPSCIRLPPNLPSVPMRSRSPRCFASRPSRGLCEPRPNADENDNAGRFSLGVRGCAAQHSCCGASVLCRRIGQQPCEKSKRKRLVGRRSQSHWASIFLLWPSEPLPRDGLSPEPGRRRNTPC